MQKLRILTRMGRFSTMARESRDAYGVDYGSFPEKTLMSPELFFEELSEIIIDHYIDTVEGTPDICAFSYGSGRYLFDCCGHELTEGEDRTILAFACPQNPKNPRDDAYQRGYPIPGTCANRLLDRGHYIPHTGGGLFGPNLFAQDRVLNRGWSEEGRQFREMETLAVTDPDAWYFVRPCYIDNSAFPYLLEVGLLQGGELTVKRFRNRFDAAALPRGIGTAATLEALLPAMSASQFGALGEETVAVWLEKDCDAIIVSMGDATMPRTQHLQDLDLVAILGEELICYEVKTRYLSKAAGRLTRKGNLRAPRVKGAQNSARQASQEYLAQRLETIIDTDPAVFAGVESRVIVVDLKGMLLQAFWVDDRGRNLKAMDQPTPCRIHAEGALERTIDYFIGDGV
ncbi:MAG: hypothetical protein LBD12_07560 [Clostridiales Family XIII bacterium]|jgi:hypothetical protein|nr:hypothetical protein [Clostridiales Family XIII bacterium]